MRTLVKAALAAWGVLSGGEPPGVAFLIYHSVAGTTRLELDIPFAVFRRQIEHLSRRGVVGRYEEAVAALARGDPGAAGRFVLSFDDGFEDTARLVFPLVRDLGLPITVFATTGLLERDPGTMRRWPHAQTLPPMTWDDLGRMRESGLVTIGAHTHSHRDIDDLDEGRVAGEIDRSQLLFVRRLGFAPIHFAYPRALWGARADRVVRERYATAVLGGGRRAAPQGFDAHRIPRVPVRRSDGRLFFKARLRGLLAGEEPVYAALKRLRRAASGRSRGGR
jgi:peptidoglycan/xylan/chitin deacetylase (PgdA/CDA1 family)